MFDSDIFKMSENGQVYIAVRLYLGQVCSIYGLPTTKPMTETLYCLLKGAVYEDRRKPTVCLSEELKKAIASRTLISHRTIEQYVNKFTATELLKREGGNDFSFCEWIEPFAKRKNWNAIDEMKVICKRNDEGLLDYQCGVTFYNNPQWVSDPATDKQKWILKKNGVLFDENITKGDAAALINEKLNKNQTTINPQETENCA